MAAVVHGRDDHLMGVSAVTSWLGGSSRSRGSTWWRGAGDGEDRFAAVEALRPQLVPLARGLLPEVELSGSVLLEMTAGGG